MFLKQDAGKVVIRVVLFLVCVAASAYAQQHGLALFTVVPEDARANVDTVTSVAPPVLSFVLDHGGIRPLVGVPGSTALGASISLDFVVAQAVVAPQNDYIIVVTSDRDLKLLQVRHNLITVRSMNILSQIGDDPDRENCDTVTGLQSRNRRSCGPASQRIGRALPVDEVRLSPTGAIAALYSKSENRIYVVHSLSGSPRLQQSWELPAAGVLTAFGVADDGLSVIAGFVDGDRGSVFVLNSGEAPRPLASLARPSAIVFLHRSHDAIVTDEFENKVYRVNGNNVFPLSDYTDGVRGPMSLAASKDNRRIYVGNGLSGTVSIIDLSGGPAELLSCNCALTGLHPTNTDSVFRLSDVSDDSIAVFDGNWDRPRIVYVPYSNQDW